MVAWALVCLVSAPTAQAALIRLAVETGVGYDDNVDNGSQRVQDTFWRVSPSAYLEMGPPERRLTFLGTAEYNQSFQHSELSRLESASLSAGYHHAFSAYRALSFYDTYTRTYDPLTEDIQGNVVRLSERDQLRESNTFVVAWDQQMGQLSHLGLSYLNGMTWSEGRDVDDSVSHRGDAKWDQLVSGHWGVFVTSYYARTDFQRSSSQHGYGGTLGTSYNFDDFNRMTLGVGYDGSRSLGDDQADRERNDYDQYSAFVGYRRRLQSNWTLDTQAGATYYQSAAPGVNNSGVTPTFSVVSQYNRDNWNFQAHASSSLGNYSFQGVNSGLTQTYAVGLNSTWKFNQYWSWQVFGDYIRDEAVDDNANANEINGTTWVAGTVLGWQFTQHLQLRLDYRYVSNQPDNGIDEYDQNRILLLLNYGWENRI